jgi:hypothetical protein
LPAKARLDPEDAIINAYHRFCSGLLERNERLIAKYMGYSVLAHFATQSI